MRKYLLPENGRFFKANLHCHSTHSDGGMTPEQLKEAYKDHGYSVLSITDHNALFTHHDLDDDDFLTLNGYEIDFEGPPKVPRTAETFDSRTVHFCIYAKDKDNCRQPGFDEKYYQRSVKKREMLPALVRKVQPSGAPFDYACDFDNIREKLKILRDAGFMITYNHPAWSLEYYPEYMQYVDSVDCLEIFNNGCYLAGWDEHDGKVYDDFLRARLLRGESLPFCTATDDNHGREEMFGGFTMFRAEKLTYACIMDAFEKGHFYASTGPEITALYVEDGRLHLETAKPVEAVRFVFASRNAKFVRSGSTADEKLTSAECELLPKYGFVRVEVVDSSSRAYTNAYAVKDLL